MADVTPGTYATFQGFPLRACQFNRSRGFQASTSTVEIMASMLPPGWSVEAPNLSTLYTKPASKSSDNRVAKGFAASGKLVLRYVVSGSEEYTVEVEPLYIVHAETVRRGTGVERVRLTLADIRYFWPRGLLPRWSFNRRRANGEIALDSVIGKADAAIVGGSPGELFTREQIARYVVSRLPGGPKLVSSPTRWKLDKSGVEFPPYKPALLAVQSLVAKAGLEDPCLRLDGNVDMPEAEVGMLGYAPGGRGANSKPFEAKFKLYKNGQGQGRVVQPGYPEEFVVVTGGKRVASVALDDWEPVLYLPGRVVVPLNEETVRKLTRGKYGMAWLSEFVLRPPNYKSDPLVDPEVTDLLGDQAWRLWRMPGVEVPDGVEQSRVTAFDIGGGEDFAGIAGLLPESVGSKPGPNAHLLPMEPRAELENGRRVAITVEIFHFTTEHITLRSEPSLERLSEIGRQIAELKAKKPPVPSKVTTPGSVGTLNVLDVLTKESQDEFRDLGISVAEVQRMLDLVRSIEDARRATSGGDAYADARLKLERQRLEEEEKAGRGRPGQTAMFDAAVEIAKLEKELIKEASSFSALAVQALRAIVLAPIEAARQLSGEAAAERRVQALLEQAKVLRELVNLRVKELAKRAANERARAAERFAESGTTGVTKPLTHVLYSNRPKKRERGVTRKIDQDAIVFDEQAGVIRTSELAGHVDPDGAPATTLGKARFVPRPVRVIFGTTLRPRMDVPPGVQGAEAGGSVPGKSGLNVIPAALSDEESYYRIAFARVARGTAVAVGINDDVLQRGTLVDDPDLVELVPLDGRSNAADLDARARELALDRFNTPDVTRSERVLLAHPWPVNCDGVVESVQITMREKDGAPCGFETLVTTGSSRAAVPQNQGVTRTRSAAQIIAAKGAAAKREGTTL